MPQPSLLATLLATVLSFVLGGLWYGPVFSKTWMRLVGVTEATLRENFNPAKTYGITFVLAFLASYASACSSVRIRAWRSALVPARPPASSGLPGRSGRTISSNGDLSR